MTSSVRTVRTAIAAALAAAVVLTTVAIPAQAGNKRSSTTTMKPRVTKNPRLTRAPVVKSGHYTALTCLKTSGDVMAHPLVINTTGQILPIGKLIVWTAQLANGANTFGTYHLTKPLYVGQSRRIPKQLPWNFTCSAYVFVQATSRILLRDTTIPGRLFLIAAGTESHYSADDADFADMADSQYTTVAVSAPHDSA